MYLHSSIYLCVKIVLDLQRTVWGVIYLQQLTYNSTPYCLLYAACITLPIVSDLPLRRKGCLYARQETNVWWYAV